MTNDLPVCVCCNKPVEVNVDQYEKFEKMHWLCFHLKYEHEGDPDKPCDNPICPWWHLEVYREKLLELGENPEEILSNARHTDRDRELPANYDNLFIEE